MAELARVCEQGDAKAVPTSYHAPHGETFRPSKRQPFEARPATGCCTNWLSSSASAMKQFVRPCAPREPLMLGVGLLPNERPLRRRIGHQRGRRRTVVLIRQGLNL